MVRGFKIQWTLESLEALHLDLSISRGQNTLSRLRHQSVKRLWNGHACMCQYDCVWQFMLSTLLPCLACALKDPALSKHVWSSTNITTWNWVHGFKVPSWCYVKFRKRVLFSVHLLNGDYITAGGSFVQVISIIVTHVIHFLNRIWNQCITRQHS